MYIFYKYYIITFNVTHVDACCNHFQKKNNFEMVHILLLENGLKDFFTYIYKQEKFD